MKSGLFSALSWNFSFHPMLFVKTNENFSTPYVNTLIAARAMGPVCVCVRVCICVCV